MPSKLQRQLKLMKFEEQFLILTWAYLPLTQIQHFQSWALYITVTVTGDKDSWKVMVVPTWGLLWIRSQPGLHNKYLLPSKSLSQETKYKYINAYVSFLKILLFLTTCVEYICLHVGVCSRVQDQGHWGCWDRLIQLWTVGCGCWDELRSSGRATSPVISPARDWKG